MSNLSIAATLEELAALLELAGSRYPARAYRRAAELIRGLPVPVEGLVRAGKVQELRGIGTGIEARLRELVETGGIGELEALRREIEPGRVALERMTAERRPLLLHRARALSEQLATALGGIPAGDARRWRESTTRLAVVVVTDGLDEVRERFRGLAEIVAIAEPDVGVTLEGVPVELVLARPEALGTALVRATGSPEYVASLGPLPEAPDEESVYRLLGLPYVPPELRELPAPAGEPPPLVEVGQIRGDLHCHTTWSDGKASVVEMGVAARALGYEYLAICDHTTNVKVVPGLTADELRRQGEEIATANEQLAPFRVLRGTECDILPDGSLDLPDDVLAELDWVQISLHAGQRAQRDELTARVTQAMRHPAARCLSHPTGRLIGHRPENALDLGATIETALETGVALEVNGLPDRLDLSGDHVREVLAAGVTIVCSTDGHAPASLGYMPLSVHTARRGGATPADVLNTRPLGEILRTSSG
jgi:DNA polymerase (family 10)